MNDLIGLKTFKDKPNVSIEIFSREKYKGAKSPISVMIEDSEGKPVWFRFPPNTLKWYTFKDKKTLDILRTKHEHLFRNKFLSFVRDDEAKQKQNLKQFTKKDNK